MRRLALIEGGAHAAAPGDAAAPRLRVAIATQDGKACNAHFGSASRFVVYDVTASGAQFAETLAFDELSDESGEHSAEGDDRNGRKIKALDGVQLLVVQAIGGPVAARVIRARIHPIKLPGSEPVEAVLDKIKALLAGEPPPWLRKVLQTEARSMAFLDDDV